MSSARYPVRNASGEVREDEVVREEPLEIRIQGAPVAVTLRTPGEDADLAVGYAWSEGLLRDPRDLVGVLPVADVRPEARGNVVDVTLSGGSASTPRPVPRPNLIHSACGLCGKTTLEAVRRSAPPLPDGAFVEGSGIGSFPDRLREHQRTFDRTGGLHAAGLFTPLGETLVVREDVGRHNAVDKVVGWAIAHDRVPLHDVVLVVSGRCGFEIAQKAWMAGISILIAVSAPTDLAIELAEEASMTLIGFARATGYNVYAGGGRVR